MRKHSAFSFTKKQKRKHLSEKDVQYWTTILSKILKVGLEFEYNLQKNKGTCEGNASMCPCAAPFDAGTKKCYQLCAAWDGCPIRKKHGCAGIMCLAFKTPCHTCPKYVKECTSCPVYNNPKDKPEMVRQSLKGLLLPTNTVNRFGETGVLDVISDNSLEGNGGVEIPTVGRRVNFNSFYDQAKMIIDSCSDVGAYTNPRTSLHVHLLAGYYVADKVTSITNPKDSSGNNKTISELEKPMPEIILANYHQLMSRYQNALVWLTSSGNDKTKLTRWARFRLPISNFCALKETSYEVVQRIKSVPHSTDSNGAKGKYMFVTYHFTNFDENHDINKLHLEARYPDGLMAPSAVAAVALLNYAIFMKAVELSQYGILHKGDKDFCAMAAIIEKCLMNNATGSYGGPRNSDTSLLEPLYTELRDQSNELVRILRPILRKHGESYEILRKLAEEPCSLRLCRGLSWDEIENELQSKTETPKKIVNLMKKILGAVDLCNIDDCVDVDEWSHTLSLDVEEDKDKISDLVSRLISTNKLEWDIALGAVVRR